VKNRFRWKGFPSKAGAPGTPRKGGHAVFIGGGWIKDVGGIVKDGSKLESGGVGFGMVAGMVTVRKRGEVRGGRIDEGRMFCSETTPDSG
jgi:hypothetical protein